jgi:hypothetical protein
MMLSLAGSITYVLYGLISWRAIATYRARPRPPSPFDAAPGMGPADAAS